MHDFAPDMYKNVVFAIIIRKAGIKIHLSLKFTIGRLSK